jgi:ribosomal-protein-alanine N-acetyltransferase
MLPADVAAVARLESATYTFPWSEGIFRDCLRAGYYCRVVESRGQCVGYAVLSIGAGEAHVLNLCVAEACRRLGIGGRLLQDMSEFAQSAGARDVYLEVRPSNLGALRLYRSRGFTQVGIRRGYYQALGGREDAVVLRKML